MKEEQPTIEKSVGIGHQKKGIMFEDEFEEILKQLPIDYVRETHCPWDFIIFSIGHIFVEMKNGKHSFFSKNQRRFMKEHSEEYIVVKKEENKKYTIHHYNVKDGRLELEATVDDLKSLAFYLSVGRLLLMKGAYGFKCYLDGYMKSTELHLFFMVNWAKNNLNDAHILLSKLPEEKDLLDLILSDPNIKSKLESTIQES